MESRILSYLGVDSNVSDAFAPDLKQFVQLLDTYQLVYAENRDSDMPMKAVLATEIGKLMRILMQYLQKHNLGIYAANNVQQEINNLPDDTNVRKQLNEQYQNNDTQQLLEPIYEKPKQGKTPKIPNGKPQANKEPEPQPEPVPNPVPQGTGQTFDNSNEDKDLRGKECGIIGQLEDDEEFRVSNKKATILSKDISSFYSQVDLDEMAKWNPVYKYLKEGDVQSYNIRLEGIATEIMFRYDFFVEGDIVEVIDKYAQQFGTTKVEVLKISNQSAIRVQSIVNGVEINITAGDVLALVQPKQKT